MNSGSEVQRRGLREQGPEVGERVRVLLARDAQRLTHALTGGEVPVALRRHARGLAETATNATMTFTDLLCLMFDSSPTVSRPAPPQELAETRSL